MVALSACPLECAVPELEQTAGDCGECGLAEVDDTDLKLSSLDEEEVGGLKSEAEFASAV
jgi:hypothetical protein